MERNTIIVTAATKRQQHIMVRNTIIGAAANKRQQQRLEPSQTPQATTHESFAPTVFSWS